MAWEFESDSRWESRVRAQDRVLLAGWRATQAKNGKVTTFHLLSTAPRDGPRKEAYAILMETHEPAIHQARINHVFHTLSHRGAPAVAPTARGITPEQLCEAAFPMRSQLPSKACCVNLAQRCQSHPDLAYSQRASLWQRYNAVAHNRSTKVPSHLSRMPRPVTILFAGDSVMSSIHEAARCELAGSGWKQFVSMRYVRIEAGKGVEPELERELRDLERTAVRVVVVVSMGLHFGDDTEMRAYFTEKQVSGDHRLKTREGFKTKLRSVLGALRSFVSVPLRNVLLVTSSFQHFPTADGAHHHSKATVLRNFYGCARTPLWHVLLKNSTTRWRVDDAVEAAQRMGFLTMPMHLLSQHWWDAHPGTRPPRAATKQEPVLGSRNSTSLVLDCTHHCYSPYMWEPLWWAIVETAWLGSN